MLRNLKLSMFGGAAQLGIFSVLIIAVLMGFDMKEAASLAIIGGADGPTAIYTTIKLAPHLLGPIAIAAYSYMALVPVIIPLVSSLLMTKKEFSIHMKKMDKQYPPKHEIKHLKTVKTRFPIVLGVVVAVFVPPLRLWWACCSSETWLRRLALIPAASPMRSPTHNEYGYHLPGADGGNMTAEVFPRPGRSGIVVAVFCLAISGGWNLAVKLYNLFLVKDQSACRCYGIERRTYGVTRGKRDGVEI